MIGVASATIHDYHNDLDKWTGTDKPESHVSDEPALWTRNLPHSISNEGWYRLSGQIQKVGVFFEQEYGALNRSRATPELAMLYTIQPIVEE